MNPIIVALALIVIIIIAYWLSSAMFRRKTRAVENWSIDNPLDGGGVDIDLSGVADDIVNYGKDALKGLDKVDDDIYNWGKSALHGIDKVDDNLYSFGKQQMGNLNSVGNSVYNFGAQQMGNLRTVGDKLYNFGQEQIGNIGQQWNSLRSNVAQTMSQLTQLPRTILDQLNFMKMALLIGLPSIGALIALSMMF